MTPLPASTEVGALGRRTLTLALDLTRDLAAFDGHFPATPILPAVAQIDWAIRIARANFALPPHFNALRALKFLRIVQPPVRTHARARAVRRRPQRQLHVCARRCCLFQRTHRIRG